MFFYLSKLGWMLAAPSNVLFLMLVVGVALAWSRWRRLGLWLLTATAAVSAIIALTPLPKMAMIALEDRFPVPSLPGHVDGIVVLAGMVELETSEARGRAALNGAVERTLVGAELAHRFPEARIVFTGGSGNIDRPDLSESRTIRPLFEQLGLGDRVIYETASRNTYQNARLTADLVDPQPGEVWLVVTSAFHMPRTVGAFRSVGWPVIPYPVDHRTDARSDWWPPSLGFEDGLKRLSFAAHEWLGLLAYWLTGRSDSLFPGPDG